MLLKMFGKLVLSETFVKVISSDKAQTNRFCSSVSCVSYLRIVSDPVYYNDIRVQLRTSVI